MRRRSHCADMRHNSRTCPSRGPKLLGVRLMDGTGGGIRKSASMGNVRLWHGRCEGNDHGGEGADSGYASEDFAPGSSSACRYRKKGVSWTEEEHRKFLLGLKKLGKGDWKGISRNFVVSRTPAQVASHAQKYFIRQSNVSRRKRRSSLFDIVADEPAHLRERLTPSPDSENHEGAPLSDPPCLEEECESMDFTNPSETEVFLPSPSSYPVAFPACLPVTSPFPFPFLSSHGTEVPPVKETHEIIKPMPVHLKGPMDVDHLLGISKLSLGESIGEQMLDLSLKLNGISYGQSAFHANLSTSSSTMHSNFSPVSAL